MDTINYFHKILELVSEKWYSDIHINSWFAVLVRSKSWNIIELESVLSNNEYVLPFSKDMVNDIILYIAWNENYEKFIKNKELDISYKYSNKERYRVNCYIDSNWYSIAFRTIAQEIPTIESLGLWETIKKMCDKSKWLILMTWPTWSGKSTNLAAMIDYINKKYKKHIITIEDPIEFVFKNNKSLINQREVWTHTKSFSDAMRGSLREDPDIIMVWEMRDEETIRAAITLAETWHLVFSTLHTNDTAQAIDRIVDIFPEWQQKQIRMQFALSLIWVISQRLLPRADVDWRIAAREILVNNDAVRNLIITWKTHQVYSVLEIWRDDWMIIFDKYLIALYNKWLITKETLISYAREKDNIEMMI